MSPTPATQRVTTRDRLLDAACELMHRKGFNSTTIDDILTETHSSKGTFFHHFASKEELGYAVIEKYRAYIAGLLDAALQPRPGELPLQRLERFLNELSATFRKKSDLRGCPCGMLAQELSERHEGFREKLASIFNMMSCRFTHLLQEARDAEQLHPDVNCTALGDFIVADLQGALLLLKTTRSFERFDSHFRHLHEYLSSLRP